MRERKNFGKLVDTIEPPNLIEIQTESYVDFLQKGVDPDRRKLVGLQGVFKEVFPIESYDGQVKLDFVRYTIGDPKLDVLECQREGVTYSAPLHVVFRLQRQSGGGIEEGVYMGEIPLMTPPGTFVINGAERVIVSQLHRSPG
ncbi:MAG: DNA-directed RNA polymerase subunit beta, partial [Verrucomicrobia bacterium]|nr:DNA-directed RNA polymerase subunit beta [Verrucomicrobiota bacterium]